MQIGKENKIIDDNDSLKDLNLDDLDFDFEEVIKEVNNNIVKNITTINTTKTPIKRQIFASNIKKTKSDKKAKVELEVIEGPLSGKTIVITGESQLITISRDKMSDILKGFGARVTKAVSGKTNILVVGDILETGRPIQEGNKYKEAQKHKTEILTMEEMTNKIREETCYKDFDFNTFSFGPQLIGLEKENEQEIENSDISYDNDENVNKSNLNNNKSYVRKVVTEATIGNILSEKIISKANTNNLNNKNNLKGNANTLPINKNHNDLSVSNSYSETQLWANKYAPISIEEIVGNSENVNKLTTWLKDWDDVVLNGNKKDLGNVYKGIYP